MENSIAMKLEKLYTWHKNKRFKKIHFWILQDYKNKDNKKQSNITTENESLSERHSHKTWKL